MNFERRLERMVKSDSRYGTLMAEFDYMSVDYDLYHDEETDDQDAKEALREFEKSRRKIAKALQVSEAQVDTWLTEARAKEGKATQFVAREEPEANSKKKKPADVTFSAADEKHLLNAQKIKREKREKRRQIARKIYLKVLQVYFPKKYEKEAGR